MIYPQKDGKKSFKIQTLPITIGSLVGSAISGIVGYIAVYFFKPIWNRIVAWWNNEQLS